MKRIISILLALAMMGLFACTAAEDEVPQPEGGRKFDTDWAIDSGFAQIYYEIEGYRVSVTVEDLAAGTASVWEYSCYYHEDTDSLVSIVSMRTDFQIDQDNGESIYLGSKYEGFDDEGMSTEFTIDADGCLIWKDAYEDAGAGLKFTNIGRFGGVWKNEEEEVKVSFTWNGIDPETPFYTVYIQRGNEGAEHYALYLMNGTYDPASGKLSAGGSCTLFTRNASGEYDTQDDGEYVEAFFSKTEDGHLLYETDNGIELEYDLLGEF